MSKTLRSLGGLLVLSKWHHAFKQKQQAILQKRQSCHNYNTAAVLPGARPSLIAIKLERHYLALLSILYQLFYEYRQGNGNHTSILITCAVFDFANDAIFAGSVFLDKKFDKEWLCESQLVPLSVQ